MGNNKLLVAILFIIAVILVINFTSINIGLSPDSECLETDGGLNFFEKGIIYGNSQDYTDSCVDGIELREYVCENNKVKINKHSCRNGCFEGKCIE